MEKWSLRELKILPKIIQLLSPSSILGQLPVLPLLFPTAKEVQSSPQNPDIVWMSKRLEAIREISDSDTVQAEPAEISRAWLHGNGERRLLQAQEKSWETSRI